MTKYVLVNDTERTRFEKEYHMRMGYLNQHCMVSDSLMNVMANYELRENKADYLIERHESGEITFIFPCGMEAQVQ